MLPLLARELIQEYSQPGDRILDPLSGIGTTGVEAIHLNRHYVGIELESRWVELQHQNLALARRQGAVGEGAVLQGDARHLLASETAPATGMPLGPLDLVLTSPPYGSRLHSPGGPSHEMRKLIASGIFRSSVMPRGYGAGSRNLGNLGAEAQLRELRLVYAGCFQVLKPGGLMLLVLQPTWEQGQFHALHHDTARLCCELGFKFLDERVALLARIEAVHGEEPRLFAHASFFQRLRIQHLRMAGQPLSLGQLEYVLVLQKPRGGAPQEAVRPLRPHKNGRLAALAGPGGARGSGENLIPGESPPAHPHPTPLLPVAPVPSRS